MEIIALFLPAVIATTFFIKRETGEMTFLYKLNVYVWFVLAVNLFSMFTVTYVLAIDGVVSDALNSFSFFMVYTLMALFFALFFSFFAIILKKNFRAKH